jgi:P pilus assembly chaperone PapD
LPRIRNIALLWTVAMMAAVHGAHAGILAQVVPVRYSVTASPGEPVGRDILLSNQGSQAVIVRVRLSDWTLSDDGVMSLVPPGSTANTLDGLVDFDPGEFTLGPGESGHIHVTLRMPADGPATLWGVLLSEVRPAVVQPARFGPRAIAELGTTFYLSRVPADRIRPEVTGMDVRPRGADSVAVTLRIRNAGERHLYVSGEIALTDSSHATVRKGPIGSGVVLPGGVRNFTWMSQAGLSPGRYLVTATLDTGEPELTVGEATLVWPMPGTVPLPLADNPPR